MPDTLKRSKTVSSASAAQRRLVALHGALHSWKAVSESLGDLDRGMLCRVANGKQHPSLTLRRALGLVRRRPSRKAIQMAALGLPWAGAGL